MRSVSVLQRQTPADRQQKFAVANVIGKLAHFRWIGARENTSDLDGRVRCRYTVGKYRGIGKTSTALHLDEKLCGRLAAYCIDDAIHHRQPRDRTLVIDRHGIGNPESR